MPAPTNLSFEVVGATPGSAASWTLVAIASVEAFATYGTSANPFDGFGRGWGNDVYLKSFTPGDLTAARFTTGDVVNPIKVVEDFAELWNGNEGYLTSLDSPLPTPATYAGNTFEAMEVGWDTAGYSTGFVGVGTDLAAGDFDAGAGTAETFDTTGWASGYKTAFVGVGSDLTAATYYAGTFSAESFSNDKAPRAANVNASTDVLTFAVDNPFASNEKVFVQAAGSYPAPLQPNSAYYALTPSGLTMKLSLTAGGTQIDITGSPDGAFYVVGDPVYNWTERMATTAF